MFRGKKHLLFCSLLIFGILFLDLSLIFAQAETSYNNDSFGFWDTTLWFLGLIFYSWFTPILIGYLLYRYWPNIKQLYSKKKNRKSKPKEILIDTKPVEIPDVKFADIILPPEVIEEVQEIVDFLRDPKELTNFGIRVPKGVLISGPPGCGKTLLARAIAGEAGVRFYAYSGSDFVKYYVGVGAATVRERFAEAKNNTPCIVFVDELDSLGRQRESSASGQEYEHALNQLLSEIDGFVKTPGLVFLGATNREDLLDPALLRSGRLDRKIIIDAPDVKGREKILRLHAKNKPLSSEVNLEFLAKGTSGFSGADLENLLNEAAIIARRRSKKSLMSLPILDNLTRKKTIETDDIEEARQKVISGLSRKSSFITEEERLITAFHEIGHVLVAKKIQGPKDMVDIVSIIPRGKNLGVTVQVPEFDRKLFPKDYLLSQISILYGGRIAEELKFGKDKITTGASNDIERAKDIARRMVCEWGMSDLGLSVFSKSSNVPWLEQHRLSDRQLREIDRAEERIIKDQLNITRRILEDNLLNLEVLACALVVKETLTNAEIDILLDKGKEALETVVGSLIKDDSKKSFFSRFSFRK